MPTEQAVEDSLLSDQFWSGFINGLNGGADGQDGVNDEGFDEFMEQFGQPDGYDYETGHDESSLPPQDG